MTAVKHITAAKKIFEDLEVKGIICGNDNHIGDIGEFYVALYFQLKGNLVCLPEGIGKKTFPYDLEIIDENIKISVKTMTMWSKNKKGSQVKINDKAAWTHLAAIMLNNQLIPVSLAIVPYKVLKTQNVFITNEINRRDKKTKSFPVFQMWPWLKDYEVNILKLTEALK